MTTPAAIASTIAGYFASPSAGGPPVAQPSGVPQTPGGYQSVDYRDLSKLCSTPAGADGLVTVTFDPVDQGSMWRVDRMVVYCSSSAPTLAFVYVGDIATQNLRDVSASGNLDIADNDSPLVVPGTRQLQVRWTGASLGAIALCAIQYEVLG